MLAVIVAKAVDLLGLVVDLILAIIVFVESVLGY